MKIECLLDASALLALIQQEPGGEKVEPLIPVAAISAVNVSEVAAKLIQRGFDQALIEQDIKTLGMAVISMDLEDALTAAGLIADTKKNGLSLGDRVCLATARRLSVPVITADREWKKVQVGVKVRCIR